MQLPGAVLDGPFSNAAQSPMLLQVTPINALVQARIGCIIAPSLSGVNRNRTTRKRITHMTPTTHGRLEEGAWPFGVIGRQFD